MYGFVSKKPSATFGKICSLTTCGCKCPINCTKVCKSLARVTRSVDANNFTTHGTMRRWYSDSSKRLPNYLTNQIYAIDKLDREPTKISTHLKQWWQHGRTSVTVFISRHQLWKYFFPENKLVGQFPHHPAQSKKYSLANVRRKII